MSTHPGYPRRAVWAAALTGLALRLTHAWTYYGFKYMDEHWQVIEPANGLVHGVWSRTVEWVDGLRCWIYPWLVSWLIRAAEALGLQDPVFIAAFIRSVHALLGTLAIAWAARYCWDLCQDGLNDTAETGKEPLARTATIFTAWFVALLPYSVYSGSHAHGEMAGALFILGALHQLLKKQPLLAGALFGVAFALKVDVAVAGLAAGVWMLLRRRWADAVLLAAGAMPFALAVGIADYIAWDSWFHSVLGHARVNLVEEIGNQWGVSPWYMHFVYFVSMGSAPAALALGFLPWLWRRMGEGMRAGWVVNLGFILVFAWVDHKEKRFMAPLIYAGAALSVATVALAYERYRCGAWPRLTALLEQTRARWAAAALLALASAVHLATEVRNYVIERPWHERVQALRHAGQVPGAQAMFAPQWPAVFYFPRHIPAKNILGEKDVIAAETRGYDIIAVAHDGKHMGWWEDAGFRCDPWPEAPRPSADPVPTAWRCVRSD